MFLLDLIAKMSLEITILTLNVWGIPYISQNKELRMQAIGEQISRSNYDIVSLQELWSEHDYNIIKEKTEAVLPYSHYFYSGVFGAGLCVFSKYPIIAAFFHAWSVNGYFHRIQHADWFGGKGVGLCRILINNKIVNIYNAHLHAEYDNENDEYKTHRVIQAFDTAQFIEYTRSDSVLQILAGDLNAQPNDISYKTLLANSKMIDCCTEENIGTNECTRNSYSSASAIKSNPIGLRIDHIFARAGKNYKLVIRNYELPFPERVDDKKFSYSDHEAVSARIQMIERNSCDGHHVDTSEISGSYCNLAEKEVNNFKIIESLHECIELCDSSLVKLKTDRIFYYTIAIFLTFILIAVIDFSVPYGLKTIFLFMKFLLISCLLFTLFMATIWNHMERNGILSSRHSMQITKNNIEIFSKYED